MIRRYDREYSEPSRGSLYQRSYRTVCLRVARRANLWHTDTDCPLLDTHAHARTHIQKDAWTHTREVCLWDEMNVKCSTKCATHSLSVTIHIYSNPKSTIAWVVLYLLWVSCIITRQLFFFFFFSLYTPLISQLFKSICLNVRALLFKSVSI